MAARADLRAASHQGVRIHHSAIVHIRAGIDVHRRHAGDALADVAAVANAGAAGHDPHAALRCEFLERICGFIEEGQASMVRRHIHHASHAEAQQDALLHPGVDAPAGG